MRSFPPAPIRRALPLLVIVLLISAKIGAQQVAARPNVLRCEGEVAPLGIDRPRPRFTWTIEPVPKAVADCFQRSYRIVVGTNRDAVARGEGSQWSTGWVESGRSVAIEYAGAPLASRRRYFWSVAIANDDRLESPFAAPASFETGILADTPWRADWITYPDDRGEEVDAATSRPAEPFTGDPARHFRKDFVLEKEVRGARAYVSGLGYYEMSLNGKRVGDRVLDPVWTAYEKRVAYATYDVTAELRRGENAVGILVGDGWWNPPPWHGWGSPDRNLRLYLPHGKPQTICEIDVEYVDGTHAVIGTDTTWTTSTGPLIKNSVYIGEVYDATREIAGWDATDFDDRHWVRAVRSEAAVGTLRASPAPPTRVTRTFAPASIAEPQPGTYVVDFGTNFTGWTEIVVREPRGKEIKLRHGELLFADGTVNAKTAAAMQIKEGGADGGPTAPRNAFQEDVYIANGQGAETYRPRFTFHGFRYVEITGLSRRPEPGDLRGLGLSADVERIGSFRASDPFLNRLHDITVNTFLSNLIGGVQSDCPHRERFGYGGDIVATADALMFNFDMSGFYEKALEDLIDAQRPNGGFTETAPYVGIADASLGSGAGPIEWGTAAPHLAYLLATRSGKDMLCRDHRAAFETWWSLLESKVQRGLLENGIGDHEALGTRSTLLSGTVFLQRNRSLRFAMDRLLGTASDPKTIEAFRATQAAIRRMAKEKGFGKGRPLSQSDLLMLAEASESNLSLDLKFRLRRLRDAGRPTTGIFATPMLLRALTTEDALSMLRDPAFPGFRYMIENGATSLWETWAKSDSVYSRNHPMFGSVDAWLYRRLGGLDAAADHSPAGPSPFSPFDQAPSVGAGSIDLALTTTPTLDAVETRTALPQGRLTIAWRRDGNSTVWEIEIPWNLRATVDPKRSDARLPDSLPPGSHRFRRATK